MSFKNYPYKDTDGNHWPDAVLGDSLYYSIDFSGWLESQNDTLESGEWDVPEDVTGEDSYEDATQAYIKLTAAKRGSHTITGHLHTIEKGKRQTKAVAMILKVY